VAVLIALARHAVRELRASRALTFAAILALAMGVGGTTAIFTLVDAVMFRSLPVADPAHLFRIGDGDDTTAQGRHGSWGFFSFPLYERLRAGAPEFEAVAAFGLAGSPMSVKRDGANPPARSLRVEYVSGTYFSTLGVRASHGRLFAADDDRPSAPPVAVLSDDAWQALYGGDESTVGAKVVVDGHPLTLVGVAAPGFFGETVRSDPPEIWIPLQQEPMMAGGGSLLHQSISPWLAVIGRTRPGASIAGVGPRLTGILRQWIQFDAGYPGNWMPDILRDLPKQTIAVVPAGAGIGFGGLSAKEQFGRSLRILFVICALVLVIACANIANLLLVRAVARQGQAAVRLAIGAARRQIVAEALAESVLIALAGGLAGVLVAIGAARLLIVLAFRGARFVPIATTPSPRVLAFAVAISLLAGIFCGAAPAWFLARTEPIDALRGHGRTIDHRPSRARMALLVVQAMLSVAVVAGSAMLARSLANLERQDFGYRAPGRVLINVQRLPAAYTADRLSSVYRDLERRLARLAGASGYGLALYNPLTSVWRAPILVAGHAPTANNDAVWDRVSAGYLQSLGVTLVRGRELTAADNETAAPVAVVNEAFVKHFFTATDDPVGQHFGVDRPENAGTFRIVGVVRDAKFARSGLYQPAAPMFFVTLAQHVDYTSDHERMVERLSHLVQGIVLVTDAPRGALEAALTRTLADVDPNLTITGVRTLQEQIDLSFDRERALASLAALFGMVALALAAVGVYALTAYMAAQRTNEIGIRMALGADRTAVIVFVLHETLLRVGAGLVAGLALAVGAARLVAAQLYGVSFADPVALAVAGGSLAVCAFLAAIVPAGRAAAISPMSALRAD
jgi:predicted permease